MFCIYCTAGTKVVNSRLQKRRNQVWRRRKCLSCEAIFTSEEKIEYKAAWVIYHPSDGRFESFQRDKLFLSLYDCLKHRAGPREDAAALTETVISKLPAHVMESVTVHRDALVRVANVALNRFDRVASAQYEALHGRGITAS